MLATGYSDIIIWSLVLMGVLIVGLTVSMRIKRRITEVDQNPAAAAGFTLSDLRAMHRRGEISNEEFEKARSRMVAKYQASAASTVTIRSSVAERGGANAEPAAGPNLPESEKNDPPAQP